MGLGKAAGAVRMVKTDHRRSDEGGNLVGLIVVVSEQDPA